MVKLLGLALVLWCLLFTFRIFQVGGVDPTYSDEENQLLKPLQARLASTLDFILPYPESALLSGIILGVEEKLPFSLKSDLKTTSTIHVVVVSGQNLSILAGFLMSLVYFLGRRQTIILTLLAIVFYSLLTGLQVPVIRAAVMVSLTYVSQLLGRERQGLWVLVLTASGMLLYNPHWLLSISFQLSFLATFGVVVVSPIFVKALERLPRLLREDLAVTLAAQLLVLPVIAYNFYQLSLVGVFSNVLVLWTIPIVMVLGFISLGVGLVSSFLGQVVGLVPGVLLTYFIYIVEFFAKVPGASIKIGETGVLIWVGYYLMVGAGVWILKIHK